MEQEYAEGMLTESLNELKRECFGSTDIILHTADLNRNRNGFEAMQEHGFRNLFRQQLNDLMQQLSYSVIACVVKKEEHLARYGVAALDPYLLSLDILVELFCFELDNARNSGVIVAERRGATLDRALELAWLNLKIQGTKYLQAKAIEERISALNLRSKRDNIAGLQLADLVVSPIGRHILGKPDREDWMIVEGKLRRGPRGTAEGYGLVVLPKQ